MTLESAHIGSILKDLRQKRGLEVSDIAHLTCVSRGYLAAIEDANFDALPAPAFTTGFIKAYAKAVDYDSAQAVSLYREEICTAKTQEDHLCQGHMNSAPKQKLSSRMYLAASVLGVIIAGGLMVQNFNAVQDASPFSVAQYTTLEQETSLPAEKDKPVKADTSSQTREKANPLNASMSEPSKPALFPAAQASEKPKEIVTQSTIMLLAIEDGWINLKDDLGNTIFEGIMVEGQMRKLDLASSVITTGNAGGFKLMRGSEDLGILGARGKVTSALHLSEIVDQAL
ncbi:DUF4115 domain-containing protein [Temperatibacter marinus]|uniref:DUF4115 domain-containing protein n=1 Tax=Temperatibacter marinus TaxID=1456591 RepID=A0AA52EF47_9PROT|nr:RodZ domain-containing protein [Temperatibacter marinus]WND01377.1 DUF4115 domain-containing protein [Temperatibacter marinus]